MHPMLTLAPGLCRNRDATISREWLITNGIGGYAMGTVAGANTRAYHGYLIAATRPPVERTLLLQHLDERIIVDEQEWSLSADEWADTTRTVQDWRAGRERPVLETFALDGTLPVWTFLLPTGRLQKRVWMAHGCNTSYIRYELLDATAPLRLKLAFGINDRDHHGASTAENSHWRVEPLPDGWSLVRDGVEQAHRWSLLAQPLVPLTVIGAWSAPLFRRVEAERGLDAVEQRYELGICELTLAPGAAWTLICSAEPLDAIERDAQAALHAEQTRQAALITQAALPGDAAALRQLVLAADQFIVARDVPGDIGVERGQSVIAGYPWFGDWGRDTMISLPGLCLSTRRYAVAAQILRTFARFVAQGMLPNRFPDAGEEPEYNTVDAALWYFHAIECYHRATGDDALLAELYPVLSTIIAWHVRGTRYGIQVDPADGLLRAGEAGMQLTWMDVRIGEWVVTPRHGKAVEINGLWYKALRLMAGWSRRFGCASDLDYAALAAQARVSFSRFWFADGGYLYDVLDTPAGDDATLRPNQIFALSVAPELLPEQQRRSALAQVTAQLWTPFGLRTLDPRHPDYRSRFTGNAVQRDGAYHQGTIWPWLIGHYLDARRELDPELDLQPYLRSLLDHMYDMGLGTIAEVFDAEPPRFGAGCMAQAWSVAELLRSALHMYERSARCLLLRAD